MVYVKEPRKKAMLHPLQQLHPGEQQASCALGALPGTHRPVYLYRFGCLNASHTCSHSNWQLQQHSFRVCQSMR